MIAIGLPSIFPFFLLKYTSSGNPNYDGISGWNAIGSFLRIDPVVKMQSAYVRRKLSVQKSSLHFGEFSFMLI